MGWASGGDIFDPVTRKLLQATKKEVIVVPVLESLIRQLGDKNWDTQDESFEEFRDTMLVVMAFAAADEITGLGATGSCSIGYRIQDQRFHLSCAYPQCGLLCSRPPARMMYNGLVYAARDHMLDIHDIEGDLDEHWLAT